LILDEFDFGHARIFLVGKDSLHRTAPRPPNVPIYESNLIGRTECGAGNLGRKTSQPANPFVVYQANVGWLGQTEEERAQSRERALEVAPGRVPGRATT